MSEKKEEVKARLSVTMKPSTNDVLNKLAAQTGLPKNELVNIGVDMLDMFLTVLYGDGEFGTKFPGDDDYEPFIVYIPGLTKPVRRTQSKP